MCLQAQLAHKAKQADLLSANLTGKDESVRDFESIKQDSSGDTLADRTSDPPCGAAPSDPTIPAARLADASSPAGSELWHWKLKVNNDAHSPSLIHLPFQDCSTKHASLGQA